jgi:predicted RNA-binding protein
MDDRTRNYWLDLFTWKTWREFLESGGEVSGFREGRWKTVQRIKPGDYLLCYLTGIGRWIGILEVTSEPYQDNSPIWKDEIFPSRVRVKVIAQLLPETAVPVRELKDCLSVFQNLKSPFAWTGHFRGSPAKWKASDGKAVVEAVLEASRNPVTRPIDAAKLSRRPKAMRAKIGLVTVPEAPERTGEIEPATEASSHTETQWLLAKLGGDMGLDVWIASNDRNREVNGRRFTDLPRLKASLPLQFDPVTNRIIQLIDVIWLRGNAIVAAFEIESTTSIYSGLLRMSDLISMQPNLNIPLYLVAPDERRDKVLTEVNRPTFSRLTPPMNQMCRFVSFSALRDAVSRYAPMVRHLNPAFLEDVSESCEVEEAD